MDPALVLTLPGDVEMIFQHVPAGEFGMGSRGYRHWEEPAHFVRITRSYYLGTYPVTQAQFAVWRPEHEDGFPDRPQHPAENMDWPAAVGFCDWLTATCLDSLPPGYVAGLPSDAQWERACRAGTETEYYTGDGEAALASVGWYDDNADGSTQAVGLLAPNAFGLYDMHGNVDEWCRDAWDEHAYKRRVERVCDPEVAGDDEADRVIRGGSWVYSPRFCRAAYRNWGWPTFRYMSLGFRVCLFSGPCLASQERSR